MLTLLLSPPHTATLLLRASRNVFARRVLGGPGSGNFGHEGRPGEVGGSGEGGGSGEKPGKVTVSAAQKAAIWAQHQSGAHFKDIAKGVGLKPQHVNNVIIALKKAKPETIAKVTKISDVVEIVSKGGIDINPMTGAPAPSVDQQAKLGNITGPKSVTDTFSSIGHSVGYPSTQDTKSVSSKMTYTPEQKAAVYASYKNGEHYKDIAGKMGMTPLHASLIINAMNQKQKALAAKVAGTVTPKVEAKKPESISKEETKGKWWNNETKQWQDAGTGGQKWKTDDNALIPPNVYQSNGEWKDEKGQLWLHQNTEHGVALLPVNTAIPKPGWEGKSTAAVPSHPAGYEWKEKTTGPQAGKFAYFQNGTQVSSPFAKEDFAKAIPTIHNGAGPKVVPALGLAGAVKVGAKEVYGWPIDDGVNRQLGNNYPKQLQEVGSKWVRKLTDDEREAVMSYTGSGYSINKSLWHDAALNSFKQQMTKNITSAIEKASSPPPPELVWRGVNVSPQERNEFLSRISSGDVIKLKGFQSTSINPSFAAGWAHTGLKFEIKPAKGAYVQSISAHKNEYEYILPHDAKYAIKGVKEVKLDGKTHQVVQLEQLA